jgi:hypothetical protein
MPYKNKGSNDDSPWWDKNGNKRFDLDDALIVVRETFQWVFSWRGAMICCGAFTIFAASLNIAAWIKVFPPSQLGSLSPVAGFVCWGVLQTLELMPSLDSLTLNSSVAALIRLQRKEIELPVVSQDEPLAAKTMKRFRNREKTRQQVGEFTRYACYALELSVLLIGGQILHSTGINWGAVLLAFLGIIGVELGLRKTNECGENLLSKEEREYLKSLKASASVSVDM